uniref:Uncharacterized protein n=1 Tax=Coccolithus braarudii TaxID=221442 RepID=A0A7S0QB52_9EUKA|mmetsp:Transcript_6985/g.15306  ORF Transcript_6985/g.15306 Transcript_6985/m.15306 type:complete len:615 (+) Transcript_6985:73-1917(+)
MEVTKDNFEHAFTLFQESLPAADFVAIDCEMTGIILDSTTQPSWADIPQQRYQKMVRVASEFSLMQVGVCLFHKRTDGGLIARPFNFFVMPDPKSSVRLVMHASTAHFHAENEMDFNKWIKLGLPFMDSESYEKQAQALLEARASTGGVPDSGSTGEPSRQKVVATKPADVEFVNKAVADVQAWLGVAREEPATSERPSSEEDAHAPESEDSSPPLELPECNSFLRRVLYDALSDTPELLIETRPGSAHNKSKLAVYRMSETQKVAHRAAKRKKRLQDLDARAGFLRVFRALTAAQRPLVGHNLLYDLLFCLRHFHAPLPAGLAELKATLGELLPVIWDTKMLAHAAGCYPDTALGPLHEAARGPVVSDGPTAANVSFALGFERYDGGGQCHEAGYDALMTGVVFAKLRGEGHALDELRNSCFLMRSLYRLDLAADDPLVESGVIIALSCFDPSVKTGALFELLSALPCVASQSARPAVRWIGDTSALVILPAGSCISEDAVAALAAAASTRCGLGAMHVQSYAAWRADVESPPSAPASSEEDARQSTSHPQTTEPACETMAEQSLERSKKRGRARDGTRGETAAAPLAPAAAGEAAGTTTAGTRRSKRLATLQ